MSSGGEEAAPFHGPYTKDILYELHRRQPHRFHFMSKFNAKSASWKDFELVVLDGELRDFARCVHCKNFVSYSSKKGTGSMLRHRCHAKESYFTAEEHNRFREMELFLRSTPQPLAMHGLGGLCSQFVPRIKTELPEPPESPLRRPNADGCGVGGGHGLLNNSDESPLDVRIHPRSPNSNGGCVRSSASVGGAPMVDNGEVEEIVASVELADDSTGDVSEDRNNIDAAPPPPPAGRGPYASARAVAERQLVDLQRMHAEEEHKLKVELLKKQHAVADLQRKYWRMKVKVLAQRAFHGDNKSVEEDESDSAD